ncbi:hypothetical protein D3C78_1661350 [compost metagenome]
MRMITLQSLDQMFRLTPLYSRQSHFDDCDIHIRRFGQSLQEGVDVGRTEQHTRPAMLW